MGRAAADQRGGLSLDDRLRRWRLVGDGDIIVTHRSRLVPVRRDGAPAMLKIALEVEERFGAGLMRWWDGVGAARVSRMRATLSS